MPLIPLKPVPMAWRACSSVAKKGLWVGVSIGAIASLWSLGSRYNLEPYVLLLGLIALGAATFLIRKCAPAALAALLYVGSFKTSAAAGLSLTDPTFIILLLCCAGLVIESLFLFSGARRWSLGELFAGQSHALLLFLLTVLMIAVSETYTTAPESGLVKLERIAVFGMVAFLAPFIFFKGPGDLMQCLTTCVALSVILSVRNLVQLYHPTAAVLAGNEDITRIGDGELIATAILILIYFRQFAQRQRLRLVSISILAVGLAASAARSAAISLLLVLAITSLILRFDRSQRRIWLAILATAIAAATVPVISRLPAARAKLQHKQDELGHLMQGSFLPGGTAEQRMNFYRQSVVAISQRPILGWGVGGWGAFSLKLDAKAIPHNFILESAVEQGLIGCSLLLALLLATGSALRQIIRSTGADYALLLPGFLLTVLVGSVTGGLDNRLLWFWCGTIFAVSRMTQLELQHPRGMLR
jgi:O-antigen ligase